MIIIFLIIIIIHQCQNVEIKNLKIRKIQEINDNILSQKKFNLKSAYRGDYQEFTDTSNYDKIDLNLSDNFEFIFPVLNTTKIFENDNILNTKLSDKIDNHLNINNTKKNITNYYKVNNHLYFYEKTIVNNLSIFYVHATSNSKTLLIYYHQSFFYFLLIHFLK